MEQQRIEVTTPEGSMTTFVHRPSHGGPHPVVLYLMDAPSIRPELHDMASTKRKGKPEHASKS